MRGHCWLGILRLQELRLEALHQLPHLLNLHGLRLDLGGELIVFAGSLLQGRDARCVVEERLGLVPKNSAAHADALNRMIRKRGNLLDGGDLDGFQLQDLRALKDRPLFERGAIGRHFDARPECLVLPRPALTVPIVDIEDGTEPLVSGEDHLDALKIGEDRSTGAGAGHLILDRIEEESREAIGGGCAFGTGI